VSCAFAATGNSEIAKARLIRRNLIAVYPSEYLSVDYKTVSAV